MYRIPVTWNPMLPLCPSGDCCGLGGVICRTCRVGTATWVFTHDTLKSLTCVQRHQPDGLRWAPGKSFCPLAFFPLHSPCRLSLSSLISQALLLEGHHPPLRLYSCFAVFQVTNLQHKLSMFTLIRGKKLAISESVRGNEAEAELASYAQNYF